MRKFTLQIIILLLTLGSVAQTPGTFNYQAVIRDASGNIISNSEIQINISIVQENENGTVVYSEDWNVETNAFGLVNLEIGSKDLQSFKAINWMDGPYYFSLSVDGEYLGASPLLSVPFAQLAQKVVEGGADDADADPTNELQDLSISGHQLTISGGNTITLPDNTRDADSDPTNEIELPSQTTDDANKALVADGTGAVSWQTVAVDTKLTETEVDDYVSNNGYQLATDDGDTDATNEIELPTQEASDANKVLAADGSGGVNWQAATVDTKLTETEVDTYVSNNGYQLATEDGDTDATNEIELPIQEASDANKVLAADGSGGVNWQTATVDTKLTETEVDTYVSNNGYQLATEDGDTDATNEIELPTQIAGDANKVLAADGSGGVNWQVATVDTKLTETEVDDYVANNGYQLATDDGDTDATNEIELPPQTTGDANKVLAADGAGSVNWTTPYSGLSNWIESSYTYSGKEGAKFTSSSTTTNVDVVLQPKGTGAIIAAEPDGSNVGGISRGDYAVDLQLKRNGSGDVASGNYSVLSGGYINQAAGTYSVVSGGAMNKATGYNSSIGGGISNTSSYYSSHIGGGESNVSSGRRSFVGAGYINTASGDNSVIGGGQENTASQSTSTIGGGYKNATSGISATVGGGGQNTAGNTYSTVGGGGANSASSSYSTVAGGYQNIAGASSATVVGGRQNNATGGGAVAGGYLNTASGSYSAVFGNSNTAHDYAETVLGTYATLATGNQTSFADDNRLFAIGNGTSTTPSNAFTILNNGNTNIGGLLTINGNGTDASITLPSDRGTSGQVLTTDGNGNASWANTSVGALSQGKIYVGNSTGVAAEQTMSGDVTITETGVTTIGSGKVTNDMLAGSITDDKLDVIVSVDKVAGSAVQLNASGSLTNDSGLKIATGGVTNDMLDGSIANDKLAAGDYMITSSGTNGQVWTSDGDGAGVWADASGSSQWTTSDSDIYYNTGNVGIGTTSLGHKLTIEDAGTSNTGVVALNATGDATFTWASSAIAPNLSGGNNIIHIIGQNESEYNAGYIGFNFVESGSNSNFLTFGLHTHDNLLNLNGAGNVGIGTTTPSYKLDVNGAINGTSVLVNGVPVASSTDTYWNTAGSGNIYYSGGNVGIGTTSPNSALEIGVASGSGWASSLRFTRSGTPNADTRIAVASDGLLFRNFDSSTSTQFSFRDYNDVHIWDLKSGGRSLFNGASDDESYSVQIGGTYSLRTEGQAIFNGNVGIGTTSPLAPLHVYGAETGENWAGQGAFGGTNAAVVLGEYDGNAWLGGHTAGLDGWSNLIINADGGNVGIGTTSPEVPLEVSGSAGIYAGANYFNGSTGTTDLATATTTFNVTIRASNDIMAGGSIAAASDKRVKENITELHNSLELIGRLRPVSYNKIDKVQYGNRLNYGFIAQEVEEVIPNAVNTGKGEVPVLKPFEKVEFEDGVIYTILVKNGDDIKEQKYTTGDARPEGEIIVKSKTVNDFKSLSYDMIFTVAVDAIQKQQVTIEAQQRQIDELKTQNAALTQKADAIDQLKAEVENLKKMITTENVQLSNN